MKKTDAIMKTGTKTVYLDVILPDGTFCRQVPYQYCPLFPYDEREVMKDVLQRYPSLANKKINLKVTNNRVF